MKNIIPKRPFLGSSREPNKAFLEQTLDVNQIPYLIGSNNLIVPDSAVSHLNSLKKQFKMLDTCIVTGGDPSETYGGRFEKYHDFSDGSIFEVDLRGNSNGLMKYLKDNYAIK